MTMTQSERRELRSVVKQQFKVLRGEVEARRAELASEAANHPRRRYQDSDKQIDDLNWRIEQVVDQANKDLKALIEKVRTDSGDDAAGLVWARGGTGYLTAPRVAAKQEDRGPLNRALDAGIAAQAQSALLTLERQEADLLRRLALGALESDEARDFLGSIPTVAQLVPASRLAEIESAFDEKRGQS